MIFSAAPTNAPLPLPDPGDPSSMPMMPSGRRAWQPTERDRTRRPAAMVRAYAWTNGRTTSDYPLSLETLVSTGRGYRGDDPRLRAEHHTIAALCQQPHSVAEVAALLAIPLNVAKILLSDMAAHGDLQIHHNSSSDGLLPDLAMMDRILEGLHRL